MEPTAQQWKYARALAAAHGHEWASHHTDGMTIADVARIAAENCGTVGGICAPTVDDGDIVLISPLGYSPTGEIFNLQSHEVAAATAAALGAYEE